MNFDFKKILVIIFLIFNNFIVCQEEANRIITIFIKKYPYIETTDILPKDLINCGTLNIPFNLGIFATYAGYLNITDQAGQLTFPRKTIKDSINLLITSNINPIFMFKNTIAYWKIENDLQQEVPAKMYKIERKYDVETQLFFWDIKERKIPKNKQIPLQTIIILTNPDNIDVPEGITITSNNPQLILPTIYAKNTNYTQNSLFAMTIKPFFSANKKLFKERPLGYAAHIT